MKMAFDVELEKKEEEPNSRVDCGTKYFGLEVLTKRTDLTKLDEEDQEVEKEIDKKVMKYFLECDLGRPEFSTLNAGIKEVAFSPLSASRRRIFGETSTPSTSNTRRR
jgi:hypothetical protein